MGKRLFVRLEHRTPGFCDPSIESIQNIIRGWRALRVVPEHISSTSYIKEHARFAQCHYCGCSDTKMLEYIYCANEVELLCRIEGCPAYRVFHKADLLKLFPRWRWKNGKI